MKLKQSNVSSNDTEFRYGLFESVVAIAFQSAFYAEMHQNDFFIFKKLFLRSAHQNDPKHKKNYFLAKKN
jgi:hypothetical protein